MGRPGACNVCCRSDRKALDDAHRGGTPTRSLARDFGVAESSLRKHFRHARPKPTPVAVARPAPVTAPADEPSVSYQKVKKAAAYLEIPLGPFATVVSDILDRNVIAASAAEEEELFAAWAAAEDDDDFVAAVIRSGRFYQETA
jgi:hypothetical protein